MKNSKSGKSSWAALAVAAVLAAHAAGAHSSNLKTVDIPPGDLTAGLETLARQSGVELVYRPEQLKGLHTAGVRGTLSSEEAVAKLLEGTSLRLRIDASGVLLISDASIQDKAGLDPSFGAVRFAQAGAVKANEVAPDSKGAEAPADSAMLSEIVVTAQKRAEKLRDVPVSIGVQTAADLEKFHALQFTDYAGYIAGLTVTNGGWPGTNQVILRGLGQLGGDTPLVSIYLDDSPISGSGAGADAVYILPDVSPFDLERVEVLRGPQGTLWGANSIAGMVRYVLVQPDLERFSARAGTDLISVNKSSELGYSVRGAVNIPLIEGKLALRASVSRTENPGYIDNALTGRKDENHSTFDGARLALLWQATDSLAIKLQALLQRTDTDGASTVRLALLHDVNGYTNSPGGLIGGNLTNYHALPSSLVMDLQRFAMNVEWDLGFADLVSTSSYSLQKIHQADDLTDYGRDFILAPVTGVTDGYITQVIKEPVRKFVQEVRLASRTDQRTEWMLGAFYDYDRVVPEKVYLPAFDANFNPVPGFSPLFSYSRSPTYKEWALFGNATYKFTPRFDLTAGLRWAENRQAYTESGSGPYFDWCCGGAENFLNPPAKSKASVVSYAVSSRYRFKDDAMAYARIATGFRPGGPNVLSLDARLLSNAPDQYGPDKDINYEIGVKSDFFDHRVQLEASVFRIDWTDIQVSAPFLGTDGQTYYANVNAGKARSDGMELSLGFRPLKGLQVTANAGYSRPRFLEDQPTSGFAKNDLIPGASQWTGSIAADYSMPVSAAWTAAVGGGVRYGGEKIGYPDPSHSEDNRTKASTLADLNAALSNDSWRVALYVRNLFDKRAYGSLNSNAWNPNPAYGTAYFGLVTQPRTIGLSIDRKF